MHLRRIGLLALVFTGLSACGVGSSDDASTAKSRSPTEAAAAATGPGTTDAANCNVPYGDPPRELSTILSGGGAGALGELLDLLNQCNGIGGETLNWTDATGDARKACLLVPPNARPENRMPLLVFLQGSIFPGPPQLMQNNWASLSQTADLTGDPAKPGFILLLPIARNTQHFYPYPDNYALGWDNWHRNLDRDTSDLNLDVAAIDAFTAQVRARNIVDDNRVYATGYSNGGAMAQLYALNTPSIAAVAVYSAPDPFTDVKDPCFQSPFAVTLPPIMDIHNACDIGGTCQTSSLFHQKLGSIYPSLKQNIIIIDSNKNLTTACNDLCASQTIAGNPAGATNHALWPLRWNDAMFTWLREHPLSEK